MRTKKAFEHMLGRSIALRMPPLQPMDRRHSLHGLLESFRFTQTTSSPFFSAEGTLAGKTIGEVAQRLRAGEISAVDVSVQYVVRDGKRLIVNTRSSLALQRAGIDPSKWNVIDMTGNAEVEAAITEALGEKWPDGCGKRYDSHNRRR